MLGNPRQSWIPESTPRIADSRYWIPVFVSGTRILDSKCDLVRFQVLELYSGFWNPEFRIPQAKFPDSGFHKQKFPGFQKPDSPFTWGELEEGLK